MNFFSIYLSCFFLLITLTTDRAIPTAHPIDQILKKQVDSLFTKGNYSGISVGVYQNGEVYEWHTGQLYKEKAGIPTDQTLYEIASLTKTFAGTILAQAIVDGKVNINDDIRDYLEGDYPNLIFQEQPITFAHLVTHNSQLPFLFSHTSDLFDETNQEKLTLKINKLTRGLTKAKFFEELANYQLKAMPGSGFAYSNVGANLLGYCLENIYQKTFSELLEQFITRPLDMKNTGILLSMEKKEYLAKGYSDEGKMMPSFAEKEMNADGGIKSTLSDMLRYMAFHLNEKNPTVKQAHTELLGGKFGGFENGLFWQMFKSDKGERKIFQNGGAPGTSSWMTFIPQKQIGVFIITNMAGPNVHQQLNETVDNILGEIEMLGDF